jgi:hypothetical protein
MRCIQAASTISKSMQQFRLWCSFFFFHESKAQQTLVQLIRIHSICSKHHNFKTTWLENSSHVTASLLQATVQALTRLLMHLRKRIREAGRVVMNVDDGFYLRRREATYMYVRFHMGTDNTTGRRGGSRSEPGRGLLS